MSIQDIKIVRARTGASLGDCRRALSECGGDIDLACEKARQYLAAQLSGEEGDRHSAELLAQFRKWESGQISTQTIKDKCNSKLPGGWADLETLPQAKAIVDRVIDGLRSEWKATVTEICESRDLLEAHLESSGRLHGLVCVEPCRFAVTLWPSESDGGLIDGHRVTVFGGMELESSSSKCLNDWVQDNSDELLFNKEGEDLKALHSESNQSISFEWYDGVGETTWYYATNQTKSSDSLVGFGVQGSWAVLASDYLSDLQRYKTIAKRAQMVLRRLSQLLDSEQVRLLRAELSRCMRAS